MVRFLLRRVSLPGNRELDHLENFLPITVRILTAETAVEEDHLAIVDVVAEAEATESKPPLTISARGVLELEDVVLSADIGGVLFKNFDRPQLECSEVPVLLAESGQEGLTARRHPDREAWRHAL